MRLTLVLAACAVAVVLLASSLRPDAFYVGDQGIKLTATRNVLRFPTTPFDIPLPTIAGEAAPHVEPFFVVHDDHAHALTSEVFPLLSAPLLAMLGLRGLYVLPAIGFLVTLLACGRLATVLDARRSAALVALMAALGTPFLFYGLEFWEHMPAVALGVCGAALLLRAAAQRPGHRQPAGAALAAGLLMGAAIVLRTEAAGFVAALFVASRVVVHRPTWRSLSIASAGIALALVPMALYSLAHFGSLVPAHVSANAGLVGGNWWAQRGEIVSGWLLSGRWTLDGPVAGGSFWSAAPVTVLAVLSIAGRSEARDRHALWLMVVLTMVLVVVTAPNSGGSQWGPRYLLFAYVPLAILAADVVQALPRTRSMALALVVFAVVCLWVQRAAYRELHGTKVLYGQMVDLVARAAAPGVPVVSDLWWLDQLAAPSLEGRTFLFADRRQAGIDMVQRFSDHTAPTITVFRSRAESEDLDSWSAGTCYFEEAREAVDVRGLVAIRLRHRCGHQ